MRLDLGEASLYIDPPIDPEGWGPALKDKDRPDGGGEDRSESPGDSSAPGSLCPSLLFECRLARLEYSYAMQLWPFSDLRRD